MGKVWLAIQHEPYRLFFPLGILFGIAGTGHWLIYGTGVSTSYSGYYHAAVQIWLYMGCFVTGFLMTAIPRFASAPSAKPKELLSVLFLSCLTFLFLVEKQWVLAATAFAGWLLILLFFIGWRFSKKGHAASPPAEFLWIVAGFLHGLAGIICIILGQSDWLPPRFLVVGLAMMEQGFLLCLVMGVGGFLGPRLMGTHEIPTPEKFKKGNALFKNRLTVHATCAALLFATFWIEGTAWARAAYFFRAVIVTFELIYTKVLMKPKISDLFQRLMFLSFIFVVSGVWTTPIFFTNRIMMLHLLFIGGFSLLTFLVSTMVVLSHSGHGEKLRKPLWIYKTFFFTLLVALSIRMSAQLFPEIYFQLLAAASGLWMAAGVAWLVFSVPFLLQVPSENELETKHKKFNEGQTHAC